MSNDNEDHTVHVFVRTAEDGCEEGGLSLGAVLQDFRADQSRQDFQRNEVIRMVKRGRESFPEA